MNYIIDLIINLALFYGFVILITLLWYSFAEEATVVDDFFYDLENINPFLDRLITGTVLALLYFITETLLKGRTVGKFVTKTKVVLEDGTMPSVIDYLKRSFSRIIPFEAFSFLGNNGRGWHDSISNTFVVDVVRFEAKKKSQSELELIGKSQDDI
ncbi:RDD family protein [Flaviramulus basaltis]|uniref:RDD family protein n=1 Tax=Flaviramulus basaltis TaxID=369401 RepID=UPI000931606B|nr:RDD family protein [Flaviramulus basaltis]